MSFSDIKGHEDIKLFFKRALNSGEVSHSYLFFGPESTGKALAAITLAKAINCGNLKNDSCDKCISCKKIDAAQHPDVICMVLGGKKDVISIEQVRGLQDRISLKPYEARTKVFIIHDSHLMSEAAANCLLKTLEEPPKNSVIILISSKPQELLPTVRSRCKQIKFEPLALSVKVELAQKMGFSKEEVLFLLRLENNGIPVPSDVEPKGLFDYKNKVLHEFNSADILLDESSFVFTESRERMKFAVSIIESWYRDILVVKTGAPASLLVNSDRAKELSELSSKFSYEELEQIIAGIENSQFRIERNVGAKLVLNELKGMLKRKVEL